MRNEGKEEESGKLGPKDFGMQSLGSLSTCPQAGPASQAAGTVGGNWQLVREGPSTS